MMADGPPFCREIEVVVERHEEVLWLDELRLLAARHLDTLYRGLVAALLDGDPVAGDQVHILALPAVLADLNGRVHRGISVDEPVDGPADAEALAVVPIVGVVKEVEQPVVLDVLPLAPGPALKLNVGEHLADGLCDLVDDAPGGGVGLVGVLEFGALDVGGNILHANTLEEVRDGGEICVAGLLVFIVALELRFEGVYFGILRVQVTRLDRLVSEHGIML